MALTSLARGQHATVKLPAPWDDTVIWGMTAWSTSISVHDVTGVRDGTTDAASILMNDCFGRIQGLSVGTPFTGESYGRGCDTTLTLYETDTSTEVPFKAFDFKYKKDFPLRDITSSGDSQKKFTYGRPRMSLTTRGYIPTPIADAVGLGDLSDVGVILEPGRILDVSIDISEAGTIASNNADVHDSNLRIQSLVKRMPFREGGPVEVNMVLVWSGSDTYTASGTSLGLGRAAVIPDSGNIELELDDGKTVTHNVIINSVELTASPMKGTPLEVRLGWVFSA